MIRKNKDKCFLIMHRIVIFAILMVLLLLGACKRNENKYLKANIDCVYKILYKKDAIIIYTIEDKKTYLRLRLYKNEYYNADNNTLFLSTKRNADFIITSKYNVKYRIEIRNNRNKVYETSISVIEPKKRIAYLATYYYDNNYKIHKIDRGMPVDFR